MKRIHLLSILIILTCFGIQLIHAHVPSYTPNKQSIISYLSLYNASALAIRAAVLPAQYYGNKDEELYRIHGIVEIILFVRSYNMF